MTRSLSGLAAFVSFLLAFATASLARAQAEDAGAPEALPWQPGPAKITLGHDLALDLPDEDLFLPHDAAAKVLEKDGSFHNENLLGLVAPKSDEARWFVTLRYVEEGHIPDDDRLDADDILKALREANDEANDEKKAKGFLPLFLDGWSEPPRYEKSAHHLVWGVKVSVGANHAVNYNTRVLGRRGWVAVNLVADEAAIEAVKPAGKKVLDATRFEPGARYEDFDAKTDKVAEYGLVGLVLGAGLGAKLVKLGLLAKFWKVIVTVVIAGKKAVVLGVAAVVAFVKRLFGRKKEA